MPAAIPAHRSRLKRFIIIALIAGGVFFVLPRMVCSTLVAFDGGFRTKEAYAFPSPDGRMRLVVTRRTAFPANELFDPAAVVILTLRDVSTSRTLDAARLELEESSDLQEPSIEWTTDGVFVTKIDTRNDRRIELHSATSAPP